MVDAKLGRDEFGCLRLEECVVADAFDVECNAVNVAAATEM